MSGIFGVLLILLFICGLFILLVLRASQTQNKNVPHPPDNTKKSRKSQDQETRNLKEATNNTVSHPPSSTQGTTPAVVRNTGRAGTQTPQKNVLLWAGMHTPITLHGYTINDPLTYWSHGSVSPDEASCLDTTLPSGRPYNSDTPPLPYWPRYSQITPDQRARYLSWLSTGKTRDLDEIGYAFLYFYGLERRALIDGKDHDLIVPEVRRLLDRYRISHSFNTYLGSFLAYVAALRLETLTEGELNEYFPDMAELTEAGTRVALAWYAQKEKPIPWQLAYSVARHFSGTPLPSVVKKETSYLERVFQTRYLSHFDGGLCVGPAKSLNKLEYKPASPSLLTYLPDTRGMTHVSCLIPHPLGRKKQFNTLFTLWESCVQDIKPFLTQISKSEGTMTRQAYTCLPEELRLTIPHPDQDAWDRLYTDHREENPWACVPVSALASVVEIEKRDRLTPAQSRDLSQTVHDGGYVLLPDPRHAGSGYQWEEKIVLLPIPADDTGALSPSFPSYALMLELGIGIAASDGTIEPEERAHLRTYFGETLTLTPFEHQCLEALEDLYLQNPPSLTRLGKRLKEGLEPDTRLSVAQYLVGMARVDGDVDPKEKKSLDRIFKAMEIEEGYLEWLLARAGSMDPADAPVVVRSGTETTGGEPIPMPVAEVTPSFAIDKGAVARILDETREVSEILSEVFAKEETECGDFVLDREETQGDISVQVTSSSGHGMEGLQPRYVPVLEELLTAEVWTKDEFVHLVQCHHCMPQATLEAINVWAETELGDFLLEDEDESIRVYRDLISS
jgi:uncharacterized tellurite resistance protein B-like protein